MRRVITVTILAALIVLAVPLGTVAAKNTGGGNGKPGKITICHKPQSAHPVTITISKSALKAHKAHGDVEGKCPSQPPPTAPKVCTFDAPTSNYASGYASGRINFSWTLANGVVKVPGGYWNEVLASNPTTIYYNNVTSGSVSPGGAVNLSFARTVPDTNNFAFSGSLTPNAIPGANTLSGLMAGLTFTATGTVTCNGS